MSETERDIAMRKAVLAVPAVVDDSALGQARKYARNTETWGESATAYALIAIAEELHEIKGELHELNAQLERDAVARAWQLP